jgi:chaperonin GroES
MSVQATNNYVWVIRDKTETEKSGLLIPGSSRDKPHTGTIFSVGATTKDPKIKSGKNKKAIFYKGIGFEIDYNSQTYLVLQDHEIIGVE